MEPETRTAACDAQMLTASHSFSLGYGAMKIYPSGHRRRLLPVDAGTWWRNKHGGGASLAELASGFSSRGLQVPSASCRAPLDMGKEHRGDEIVEVVSGGGVRVATASHLPMPLMIPTAFARQVPPLHRSVP